MVRRLVSAAIAAAVISALFAGFGSAAVNVAQSGWAWGNPTPQGNTLHTIDFVQGRGYAAGDGGTVLRTDDGGTTWTGLATGTSAQLYRLQVIDPETLVVLGGNGGCVLRRSDDAGKTFHKLFNVTEQGCTAPLDSFTFVDRQGGYLMAHDRNIFRTSDGGQTFARPTAIPGTQANNNNTRNQVVDIAFTTADNGVAFVQPPNGASSIAFATTDAGISWKPIDAIDPGRVHKLWFLDAQHGFAVGLGTLLTTDDGGKTWKAQSAAAAYDLASIRCVDPQTCILTTTKNDKLLRTVDGGKTFTEITASSQALAAAAFASATRVVAIGAAGTTVVSNDGGVNYTPISTDIGGDFNALRVGPNPATAFALGTRGNLAETSDNGATWKTLAVPTAQTITDVSFADPSTGYALDARGGLFKSTNAGTSWQTLDTGTTSVPGGIAAPRPDVIVVVGPRGIRRAQGAAQPALVGSATLRKASLDTIVSHPNLLVAYGSAGTKIFLSGDTGKTWKTVVLPKKVRLRFGHVADFVSPRIGMFIDSQSRTWKTTSGGKKWAQVTGIGSSTVSSISMGDAASALVSVFPFPQDASNGETAFVLSTSDGGKTWRPQAITPGRLTDAVAGAGLQGYALVGSNHLFFSTSGGDAGTLTNLTLKTKTKVFSKKAFKKSKGRVSVTGTLPGAVGGERIIVSRRDTSGSRWSHQLVTAGANGGSFTTSWKIRRSSIFVAQWAGDSGRRGAGSTPLTITVKTK